MRTARIAALVVAVIVVVAGSLAVSLYLPRATTTIYIYPSSNLTSSISAKFGETFIVQLTSNANSTSYDWRVTTSSGVQYLNYTIVSTKVIKTGNQAITVIASGPQVRNYFFRAVQAGNQTVTLQNEQSLKPSAIAATINLKVVVSPSEGGANLTLGITKSPDIDIVPIPDSSLNDWPQSLQWISQNTPKNAVVIAWSDYDYWIDTVANRTAATGNGTINATRIALTGQMFFSNTTTSLKIIKQIAGDRPAYVMVFLTGSILSLESSSGPTNYYILYVPYGGGRLYGSGGGDESKKEWFIRIGGLNESQYLECPSSTSLTSAGAACESEDDFNLTPYALQNTLFAQLFPFKFAGNLVETASNGTVSIDQSYQFMYSGAPPIELFSSPLSYTFPSNSTGPFRLVYSSPSLVSPKACPGDSNLNCFNAVLIYQVVMNSTTG